MDEPDVRAARDLGSHSSFARMRLKREIMTPLTNAARPAAAIHDYLAPVFAQYPIEVVSAQGVWLTNSRGERVLDLYGGHAVAALGYGHPGFTRALISQAESCNFQS